MNKMAEKEKNMKIYLRNNEIINTYLRFAEKRVIVNIEQIENKLKRGCRFGNRKGEM